MMHVLSDSGGDFYPGYQGYNEFFPGQGPPDGPGNMNFLPPSSQGTPPLSMDQQMHPAGEYHQMFIITNILTLQAENTRKC